MINFALHIFLSLTLTITTVDEHNKLIHNELMHLKLMYYLAIIMIMMMHMIRFIPLQ